MQIGERINSEKYTPGPLKVEGVEYKVFVDGKEQPHCYYAHEQGFKALVYVMDENGQCMCDPSRRPISKLMRGDVKIVPVPVVVEEE